MLNRIVIFLFVSLCAVLAYLFYSAFEYYEEDKDVGWGNKARKNPYLALELYALKNGASVKTADSYFDLGDLNAYQFIYIANSDLLLSEARILDLMAWVKSGGMLFVGLTLEGAENDHLLRQLNISLYETDYWSDSENGDDELSEKNEKDSPQEIAEQVGEELRRYNESLSDESRLVEENNQPLSEAEIIEQYESDVGPEYLTLLSFEGVDAQLKAELDTFVDIYHPAMNDEEWSDSEQRLIYWAGTEYGVHFAQLEVGAGLISLSAGETLLNNHNVAHFDHAYLWGVLSNGEHSAVLYGSTMPSLWRILKNIMPELLLSLLLLFVCSLWCVAGYFGSKREFKTTSRRAFHEHLAASAGFYWRNKWQLKLLKPLRDDIISAAKKGVSGFESASPDERIKLLSNHSGISAALIQNALYQDEKLNDDGFTKTVQILQKLRGGL